MRTTAIFLMLLSLAAVCGCGGGGGGDAAPALPGTLIALAVQGQATPAGAPTAGTFAAINVGTPVMDCAAGGWCAFVATVTTGGGPVDVLYVAEPNGDLHEVYAVGDTDPGAGSGTITGFGCVWMCPNGTVFAYCTLTTPTFAVLSAEVTGGAVQNRQNAVMSGQLMPDGGANTLTGIDFNSAQIDLTCTFWFLGTLSNAVTSLYSVEPDGSGDLRHISTGEGVPPASTVAGLDEFGVAEDGSYFAFVADLGGGTQGVYITQTGTAVHRAAGSFGDAMPDGNGTIADAYKDGPLLVFNTGQVLWAAIGSVSAGDHALLFHSGLPAENPLQLARTGGPAPGTVSGTLNALTVLNQRVTSNVSFPQFVATISGGGGITISIYAIGGNGLNRFMYNGRPFSGGGNFTGTFQGLTTPKLRDGTRDVSFVYRDTLDTATIGLFWVFSNRGPFAVALTGGSALGGTDTYGSFAGTAHTCANNVCLFTALLTGAGSGIFRQG